jgi:hypothetical protein
MHSGQESRNIGDDPCRIPAPPGRTSPLPALSNTYGTSADAGLPPSRTSPETGASRYSVAALTDISTRHASRLDERARLGARRPGACALSGRENTEMVGESLDPGQSLAAGGNVWSGLGGALPGKGRLGGEGPLVHFTCFPRVPLGLRLGGTGDDTSRSAALLRSRSYAVLLVLAAIVGVPVSAAAYFFLALVSKLQEWIFTRLPKELGFTPSRCGGLFCRWCWPGCWLR